VAARRYRTSRRLYLQVTGALDRLGVAAISSPTTAILIALYVTGLVLLDSQPTQTPTTCLLPGRCHHARNRLLRTTPWSTRALTSLLVAWSRRAGASGYLCLDDVVADKAFAKQPPWAGWTSWFAKKRKVDGMHIVVLLWCSSDGGWRIRSRSGCGGPSRPAPRTATRPSHSWPRKCSARSGLPACRLPTW
jgi:hypothetical protein